jgi:hypothetical protein
VTDKEKAEAVILESSLVEEVMGAMRASILRLAQSQAPESRERGLELQERYLDLSAAVDRHQRLVDLWGWERQAAEPEPLPATVPHLASIAAGNEG